MLLCLHVHLIVVKNPWEMYLLIQHLLEGIHRPRSATIAPCIIIDNVVLNFCHELLLSILRVNISFVNETVCHALYLEISVFVCFTKSFEFVGPRPYSNDTLTHEQFCDSSLSNKFVALRLTLYLKQIQAHVELCFCLYTYSHCLGCINPDPQRS